MKGFPLLAAALLAAPLAAQTPPSKVFNPDISVIGDFLAIAGHNDVEKRDALELHESEVGLQAIVDPYARADFFLTFSNDEVGVEEGYITFLNIPGELLVKAGKLKGAFGKLNTEHLHVRLFADAPLPMLNLMGGEDGVDDAGVSVSRLIPAPKDIFIEATAQLFRGSSGPFESHKRNDVEPLFHLRAYKDLSESMNLDLGGSWTQGNGLSGPSMRTRLWGADATFRWKPLRQGLYRSLLVRAEYFRSERDTDTGRVNADGYYVHGQWQLARRWFVGARHDESDHADDASKRDHGNSVVLTFWPSEFSQLRAQVRRNRYEREGLPSATATELLFQVQFVIGAHGAHPF
jgi:hypothetical protein